MSDYKKLVAEIRRSLGSDIEKRFRIGALVDQALADGAKRTTLAQDVGVSWATLDTYHRTFKLWGADRAKTAACWSDYSFPARWPAAAGHAAKAAMLDGGKPSDVARDYYQSRRSDEIVRLDHGRSLYNEFGRLNDALQRAIENGDVQGGWYGSLYERTAEVLCQLDAADLLLPALERSGFDVLLASRGTKRRFFKRAAS